MQQHVSCLQNLPVCKMFPACISDAHVNWDYLATNIDSMDTDSLASVLQVANIVEEQRIHINNIHTYMWLTQGIPYEPNGCLLSVGMLLASLQHEEAEERLCLLDVPLLFVLHYIERRLQGPFFHMISKYIKREAFLRQFLTHNFACGDVHLAPLMLDVIPLLGYKHPRPLFMEIGTMGMFTSSNTLGSLAVLLRHHGEGVFASWFSYIFYGDEELIRAQLAYIRRRECYKYALIPYKPPDILLDLWKLVIAYAAGVQCFSTVLQYQRGVQYF
jgi:hypothetical protein